METLWNQYGYEVSFACDRERWAALVESTKKVHALEKGDNPDHALAAAAVKALEALDAATA